MTQEAVIESPSPEVHNGNADQTLIPNDISLDSTSSINQIDGGSQDMVTKNSASGFIDSLDSLFSELENEQKQEEKRVDTEPTNKDKASKTVDNLLPNQKTKKSPAKEKQPAVNQEDTDEEEGLEEDQGTATTSENDLIEDEITEDPVVAQMTPKAKSAFMRIKSEAKSLKLQLHELRLEKEAESARIAELEAIVNHGDTVELKEKLDMAEKELSISRLEATPEYQRGVREPLAAVLDAVDNIAMKYGVDPDVISDALSLSDPDEQDIALQNAMAGFRDRDKRAIYDAADTVKDILQLRQKLSDKASEVLRELEVAREVERQREMATNAKKRAESAKLVGERIIAKLPFLSSEEFATDTVIKNAAIEDFENYDPTRKAYGAIAAGLLPKLALAYAKVSAELAAYKETETKVRKATPGAGSGRSATQSQRRGNVSFLDSISEHLG